MYCKAGKGVRPMWKRRFRRKRAAADAPSLSILCAGLFLALSVFAWIQDQASPERQARKMVKEIYTVNRMQDLTSLYEKGLPALYEEEYAARSTEAGNQALSATGLPYVLLFREFSAPVERTCVVDVELRELETGEPGLVEQEAEQAVHYAYHAQVDFHLEKGLEALAPVEPAVYDGTISMEKKGLFRWRLDDVTVK